MFLGYQNAEVEKTNKIMLDDKGNITENIYPVFKEIPVMFSEKKEILEELPGITFTKIVETNEPVENIRGKIYVGDEIIEAKKEYIRGIRNNMLKSSDEWGVEDREKTTEVISHREWREYLRNYTKQKDWWEQNPLNFEEWKSE